MSPDLWMPPRPTDEQMRRLRAVTSKSPILERAGAAMLGAYMPLTGDEANELDEIIERYRDRRSNLLTLSQGGNP